MSEKPKLIHTVPVFKWTDSAHILRSNFDNIADAKYDTAAVWVFSNSQDKKKVPLNEPGGFSVSMRLEFRLIDGKLDRQVNLPTGNEEIGLQFFDRRPNNLPHLRMLFRVIRRKYYIENCLHRGEDLEEYKVYRFRARMSDPDEYNGYLFELNLAYHYRSSRADELEKLGTVFWLAITQKTEQTTLEQHT